MAGRPRALYPRHAAQVAEMERRGYRHASPLDPRPATGEAVQTEYVDPPERQFVLLRAKGCDCAVAATASPDPTPTTGAEPG